MGGGVFRAMPGEVPNGDFELGSADGAHGRLVDSPKR